MRPQQVGVVKMAEQRALLSGYAINAIAVRKIIFVSIPHIIGCVVCFGGYSFLCACACRYVKPVEKIALYIYGVPLFAGQNAYRFRYILQSDFPHRFQRIGEYRYHLILLKKYHVVGCIQKRETIHPLRKLATMQNGSRIGEQQKRPIAFRVGCQPKKVSVVKKESLPQGQALLVKGRNGNRFPICTIQRKPIQIHFLNPVKQIQRIAVDKRLIRRHIRLHLRRGQRCGRVDVGERVCFWVSGRAAVTAAYDQLEKNYSQDKGVFFHHFLLVRCVSCRPLHVIQPNRSPRVSR